MKTLRLILASLGTTRAFLGAALLAALTHPNSATAQLSSPRNLTTLHTFAGRPSDGLRFRGPLLQTREGLIYGITSAGGANDRGTLFRIRPDGSGYQVVYSYGGRAAFPVWLIEGRDGRLYGTATDEGFAGGPVLYRINTDGSGLTILHAFPRGIGDLSLLGRFFQGADGYFYGVSAVNIASNFASAAGGIWRCAPDGTDYRVLYVGNRLTDPTGPARFSTLIQGQDGDLYAATALGGANDLGTIVKLRTDGSGFRVIHSFARLPTSLGFGSFPEVLLVQASDGLLYGSAAPVASIFRINPDGTNYRTLHDFRASRDEDPTGAFPGYSFFEGRDGSFYGVTAIGGAVRNGATGATSGGGGAIYKIRPDGSGMRALASFPFRTVVNFTNVNFLIQGSDGALYSGSNGDGLAPEALYRTVEEPVDIVITQQPFSQTVASGSTVTFTVAATGATSYQWRRDGTNIAGATAATLTLNNLTTANAGTYTVVASNATGSVTSNAAALVVAPLSTVARLSNLSILTSLAGANDSFTLGYVVGGAGTSGTKPLVIRAVGPSLTPLGVGGALADPKLETFAGATKTGENDNWGGGTPLFNAMEAVGAFRFTGPASLDAAVATSVALGDNSVKVTPVGNLSGSVIAEIYDGNPAAAFSVATPRLVNVSVLKNIGTSLTAGFVIGGTGSRTLLIRAIGPTLGAAPFNVPGVVADPQLVLFNSASARIGENDNWGGAAALSAAFTAVGAFQLSGPTSRDAALLATLQPGNYTVQVSGVGGTTGTALVEVYEVP